MACCHSRVRQCIAHRTAHPAPQPDLIVQAQLDFLGGQLKHHRARQHLCAWWGGHTGGLQQLGERV